MTEPGAQPLFDRRTRDLVREDLIGVCAGRGEWGFIGDRYYLYTDFETGSGPIRIRFERSNVIRRDDRSATNGVIDIEK